MKLPTWEERSRILEYKRLAPIFSSKDEPESDEGSSSCLVFLL
jgi:hypothetical protein